MIIKRNEYVCYSILGASIKDAFLEHPEFLAIWGSVTRWLDEEIKNGEKIIRIGTTFLCVCLG